MGVLAALKRLLTPGEDLASQTVRGGLWVALTNAGTRALQLAMLVVLARLLSPADFGLMGIALLVISALTRFSQLGLDEALIQRAEENVDHFLDTVFTLQLLRGLLIAGVAYVSAPLVALLFDAPDAVPLLRLIALGPLLRGLENPGIIYFRKDLHFHKHFTLVVTRTLVRVVVSVGYALVNPTVYALAYGYIAGYGTLVAMSYILHGNRPRPAFEVDLARELVDYGKWLLGSEMLSYLYREGDDAFVGAFLSAQALGFYQLSYRLSNAPATEISQTVSQAVMPAYSKMQDDFSAVREGFRRTLRLSTLVAFPLGVGITVIAPSFVAAFLGEQWLPMVVPMQLLAIYGLGRSLWTPCAPLFKALGRPDFLTKLQALRLTVLAALVYPLTITAGLELTGAALAVVASGLVAIPVAGYLAVDLVDERVRTLLTIPTYPAVASVLMGATAYTVQESVATAAGPFVTFFATALAGMVVYPLLLHVLEWRFEFGLYDLVGQVRQSM